MELEKLKNTWEKVSEIDARPNDKQILNLLKTSNKNYLDKIIRIETNSLRAFFILPFLFVAVNFLTYLFFPQLLINYLFMVLFIFVSFAAMAIWQSYKLKYLKKIDITNSSIISVSRFINKYRKNMIYETVTSLIWFTLFVYILLTVIYPDNALFEYLLFGGTALILVVFSFFLTKIIYKNTIEVIERNLEEMKAFERED